MIPIIGIDLTELPLSAAAVLLQAESFGVSQVVGWLSKLPSLVVLPLIAVAGETVVLASTVVATQGEWSLNEVILWCLVGTVASDLFWFKLAGTAGDRLKPLRDPGPRQQAALKWLRRRTGERPYLALLFFKFLYGTRFLMLVYLATRDVSLRRFLLYDIGGTILWLAILVPAGWLLGVGLIRAEAVSRLDLVLGGVVVAVLAGREAVRWKRDRARRG